MADIFLSYAREDRERAKVLARALEAQGWSVWWDKVIPAGRTFHEVIDEELEKARCVVVAWSKTSITKEWVIEEADDGRERDILVPVYLDKVKPPRGFRLRQAADLVGWNADASDDRFKMLVSDITALLGSPSGAGVSVAPAADEEPPLAEGGSQPPDGGVAGEGAEERERRTEDGALNRRISFGGGTFLMGSAPGEGDDDEHPQRRVAVSPFVIQAHPVTNREYRRFRPKHDPDAPADHPVVRISWDEAMEYAEWLDGSLPTEAQWEFAARGEEGRTYPWGEDEPDGSRARFGLGFDAGPDAVGSWPAGATPEGVHDLAGNVWEWCRDWHGEYPHRDETDPLGPEEGSGRVLRGGSFIDIPRLLRGAYRNYDPPAGRFLPYGFRVAWPAAPGQ